MRSSERRLRVPSPVAPARQRSRQPCAVRSVPVCVFAFRSRGPAGSDRMRRPSRRRRRPGTRLCWRSRARPATFPARQRSPSAVRRPFSSPSACSFSEDDGQPALTGCGDGYAHVFVGGIAPDLRRVLHASVRGIRPPPVPSPYASSLSEGEGQAARLRAASYEGCMRMRNLITREPDADAGSVSERFVLVHAVAP